MIDDAEFTKQYEEHAASVLRYMTYKFGADRAEDVAASAWLKAWAHRGTFKGDSSFKTWVTRIALNKGFEDHRYMSRRRHAPLTLPLLRIAHDSNVVERGIIATDLLAHVTSRVKPRDMAIFKMRYVYKMTVDDVAGELRMNVSTVKTRMRRTLDAVTK